MTVTAEKGRILVVDDEPMNVALLRGLLSADHEVLTAESGAEALALVEKNSIDLILLDVMMPGMDGLEVCQQLKSQPTSADIPVIFVSARGEMEDEAKGLEVGGIDYITKPVKGPVVKARVRNHLALKRYQDQLSNLATLDGLTGIPNRRKFDEVLAQEWRRNERAQTWLSVMLCDIDFFKQYNDHYGHLAGDDCLKAVASTLDTAAHRPYDFVARYGGEEFAFILPQTNQAGAEAIASQTMAALAELALPHEKSKASPQVTLSIGISSTVPSNENQPQALLQKADEALYQAKASGRNRHAFLPF